MSGEDSAALDRAIALALADAVASAGATGARSETIASARDAAQVLGLDGLAKALDACAAHVGRATPRELEPLLDRLRRIASQARESSDLAPFRAVDQELGALAGELDALEWSEDDDPKHAAVPTLSVEQVLEEHAIAGDESQSLARRSRLTVPVAAAVRAALDWLTPPGQERLVRLHGEPSLLEVRLRAVRIDRLHAVDRVLAEVSGNLGPLPDAPDPAPWIVRVPSFAIRSTYLLLVQGELRIAIPWHAVLKLRMVPVTDATPGTSRLEHPLLPTVSPPAPTASEVPAVLIGHGLKRGYVTADRVIWRMLAEPWGTPAALPTDWLTHTVETEEGEVYWVVDPGRALAHVEPPIWDLHAPVESPPMPIPTAEPVAHAAAAPTPAAHAPPPLAEDAPTLTEADVQPLDLSPWRIEAAAREPVAQVGDRATREPTPPAEALVRALVADDSLVARVRLTRWLERQGFEVIGIGTAAELLARLETEPWSIAFTDVDLPGAPDPGWLAEARRAAAAFDPPARLIALVRDRDDVAASLAAGIHETLSKPVHDDALRSLLTRIGPER